MSLVVAGLTQSQVRPKRITRFALTDGAEHTHHVHFECDHCGHVYCLPVKPPRRAQLRAGFGMAGGALQFPGHCPGLHLAQGGACALSDRGMNRR